MKLVVLGFLVATTISLSSQSYAGIFDNLPSGLLPGKASQQPTPVDTEEAVVSSETPAETIDAQSWENLADQQEIIVKNYVAANLEIARAQVEMAQALGLKDQASLMKTEAEALSADSAFNKKQFKHYTKVSKKTNKLIQKKLKQGDEISLDGRKKFSKGMLYYAYGIDETDNVIDEAEPFAASVRSKLAVISDTFKSNFNVGGLGDLIGLGSSESGQLVKKFATGLYITKSAPSLLNDHGKTLGQIVNYAKSNEIAVPNEVAMSLGKTSNQDDSNWKDAFPNLLGGTKG